VSATPARLSIESGRVHDVAAWAGPWPADERWWDTERRRRRARFQVVTADGQAHLVALESGRWWVTATYD
jgi:protein ImuB